ncbi:MAG: penicillin-binding transpeptidase domain-containing protein, partial [Geminicoccaceae bacterium]
EVIGLGDGLWSWFGADFDRINDLLTSPTPNIFELWKKAQAYKQVLALLIAQRRPSHYLLDGRQNLIDLCDQHLRLLIKQGVIEPRLGEAALGVDLKFQEQIAVVPKTSYLEQKAATAIRTELLGLLGVRNLYDLDRLDLTLESTIDIQAQQLVTDALISLQDPEVASTLGLYGHRLLRRGQSNNPLLMSLTVYERGDQANYLRVQADNLDQPFDLNNGAKLDLGSTAKLRTLITYLEVIAAIHQELVDADHPELSEIARNGPDPLTRWAAANLAGSDDRSLTWLLEEAMAKRYSANPNDRFRTGGGLHRFANFDDKHDRQIVTVAQAMRHSINLPLIRMMRDIANYHIGEAGQKILNDPTHPKRYEYLERFAHDEARTFLRRFHREFGHLDADASLVHLAKRIRQNKHRLAALHRFVRPDASLADFAAFMGTQGSTRKLSTREIEKLYEAYDVNRFKLTDQAYLVRLHPLNLWLGRYLQNHPSPSFVEVKDASVEAQKAGSAWLFKTNRKRAQNQRIRQMLEEDAFKEIHAAWKRLGYPFPSLVPSYATSIGSSADRPEALATLVGIILNDGMLRPTARIEALHFAASTPYETRLERRHEASVRVMSPEIASVVRRTMVDVVENGSARRLRGGFDNVSTLPVQIGAKTGTGDHRRKTFDRRGNLLSSEAVNRSATVVFFIGERLFGNLTIFVAGEAADRYSFTSSLPAQLLKALAPALKPLMEEGDVLTVDSTSTRTGT